MKKIAVLKVVEWQISYKFLTKLLFTISVTTLEKTHEMMMSCDDFGWNLEWDKK